MTTDDLRKRFNLTSNNEETDIKIKLIGESFFHTACLIEKYGEESILKITAIATLELAYVQACKSIIDGPPKYRIPKGRY